MDVKTDEGMTLLELAAADIEAWALNHADAFEGELDGLLGGGLAFVLTKGGDVGIVKQSRAIASAETMGVICIWLKCEVEGFHGECLWLRDVLRAAPMGYALTCERERLRLQVSP